jgi:hypothetical protein
LIFQIDKYQREDLAKLNTDQAKFEYLWKNVIPLDVKINIFGAFDQMLINVGVSDKRSNDRMHEIAQILEMTDITKPSKVDKELLSLLDGEILHDFEVQTSIKFLVNINSNCVDLLVEYSDLWYTFVIKIMIFGKLTRFQEQIAVVSAIISQLIDKGNFKEIEGDEVLVDAKNGNFFEYEPVNVSNGTKKFIELVRSGKINLEMRKISDKINVGVNIG